MKSLSEFQILSQPDETTCGPTCLQAVYHFFGKEYSLDQVISETPQLDDGGGTLAVSLGSHALEHGYRVKIYTYNLRVFDPSWFSATDFVERPEIEDIDGPFKLAEKTPCVDLMAKLDEQSRAKDGVKLQLACRAYAKFIEQGGRICMHDLNKPLIRFYLGQSIPLLTGLSSTYLYQACRERQRDMKPDDIRGTPTGHFVVLCGENRKRKQVRVADPFTPNPFAKDHYYDVNFDRLICAILLGVLTYDANLLIIEPAEPINR